MTMAGVAVLEWTVPHTSSNSLSRMVRNANVRTVYVEPLLPLDRQKKEPSNERADNARSGEKEREGQGRERGSRQANRRQTTKTGGRLFASRLRDFLRQLANLFASLKNVSRTEINC